MEEGYCESAIKIALFVAWTYGTDDIQIGLFRYDRACSLVPCVKNLLKEDSKKPFLPDVFRTVWTSLVDKVCLDGSHVLTHTEPQCNIDHCDSSNIDDCKFDPRLPKFGAYSGSNSQTSEQTWNIWGPFIGSITNHSTQHRSFWFIFLFKEIRNEWMEKQMEKDGTLVSSGLPKYGGFLKYNWKKKSSIENN